MARRRTPESKAELESLAEDWVALWQSEIAGRMADPELVEAWGAAMAMGAAWLRVAMPLGGAMPPGFGPAGFGGAWPPPPPGYAPPGYPPPWPQQPYPAYPAPPQASPAHDRADAPPRPAADAPAPDAGGQPRDDGAGDPAALLARIAELEQRLAELERKAPRAGAGSSQDRRSVKRRRPSA